MLTCKYISRCLPSLSPVVLLAVLAGMPGTAAAQADGRAPSAVGTAGGGAAFVEGTDALFLNPANLLASRHESRFEISLGTGAAFGGGDFFQFQYYDAFTRGAHISPDEARTLTREWFGDLDDRRILRGGISSDAVLASGVYRSGSWGFGVGLRTRTHSLSGINGGWLDLFLTGADTDRTVPLDGEVRYQATTDISIAFARRLGERLSIGVAPKLVVGKDYLEFQLSSEATVSSSEIRHDYAYTLKSAGAGTGHISDQINLFAISTWGSGRIKPQPFGGAGTGFGVDLGLTMAVGENFLVAASATDVGFVRWNRDAEIAVPADSLFLFEGFELDLARLREDFDGDVAEYVTSSFDSLARASYDNVIRSSGPFSTVLPAAAHVGVTWSLLGGRARLSAGSSLFLVESAAAVSRMPSFYAGGEMRLGSGIAVPLRAGVHVGGSGAVTLAAGIGLDTGVYEAGIGLSATPYSNMIGSGGRYTIAATLAKFRF